MKHVDAHSRKIPLLSWGFFLVVSFLLIPSLQAATEIATLDGIWQIKLDPSNQGKAENWQNQPLTDTTDLPVPGIIQQVFRDYHGVAWYERSFNTPANPNLNGRTILKFWQVDYYCQVWINEKYVGEHEGGESVFEFDVTDFLNPVDEANRIVVRVICPTDEPIENFTLHTTPHRNSTNVITPGCDYYASGLIDTVELQLVPEVRIADVFLMPDWKTGNILARVTVNNFGAEKQEGQLSLKAALSTGNEWTAPASIQTVFEPGTSVIEGTVFVPNHRLWELNSPNLYNVLVGLTVETPEKTLAPSDEKIARSGFRDFRFENGYFRLNGKRIYVKCSHTGSISPVMYRMPLDPEIFRKDIYLSKAMGMNMIRYIAGMPRRFQLDMCDEFGFMVYDECYAAWVLHNSEFLQARYNLATEGLILRDRNHPCVVLWGFLNETIEEQHLRAAEAFLLRARELDPTRLILFNSGSFDKHANLSVGFGSSVTYAAPLVSEESYSSWRTQDAEATPFIAKNLHERSFSFEGTNWPAQSFALHPGDVHGEYAVLKWTAPKSGAYTIDADFSDITYMGDATVDISLFKGETAVFQTFLNLMKQGENAQYSDTLSFQEGEEFSVVVGMGDGDGHGDTTGVKLTMTSEDGTINDAVQDCSFEQNPNGVWSYGWVSKEKFPDLSAFTLFDKGTIRTEELKMNIIGRFSNPKSLVWQDGLCDTHPYQPTPHDANVIKTLREHNRGHFNTFLSEYGIGSGVNLYRLTRYFEQYGQTESADAVNYRGKLDQLTFDWNLLQLDDTFSSLEAFLDETIAWMADQRRYGINAIRSNPTIVAQSITGTHDQGISGEGLTTLFREFKPGTLEAIADIFAPLRFCLFVEPVQVYRGKAAHFEAVLVNEDILQPGDYPVRYQIIGPSNTRVFDRTTTLTIPEPAPGTENPFAIPVFAEDIVIDGPSGEYHFLATFLEKGASNGGKERFYVADAAEMPTVDQTYIVWGNDQELLEKLKTLGINAVPYQAADGQKLNLDAQSLIVVGKSSNFKDAADFAQLFDAVQQGANVLFLSANKFIISQNTKAEGNAGSIFFQSENDALEGPSPVEMLPFEEKGSLVVLPSGLYHKDDWNKRHPIFDGLPSGVVLDHLFYREVIPTTTFSLKPLPDEVVAGGFNTTIGYGSALSIGVWYHGKGKIIINTFKIQNNLPSDPVAERMLRNMLLYLAKPHAK